MVTICATPFLKPPIDRPVADDSGILHRFHGRTQDLLKVALHGNAFVGPACVNDQARLAPINRGYHGQGVGLRPLQFNHPVAVAPQSLERNASVSGASQKADGETREEPQGNRLTGISCPESQ